MGVASPFQSRTPLEYWLSGLITKELVLLWEFLSWNQDTDELILSGNPPNAVDIRNLYKDPGSLLTSMLVKTQKAFGPLSPRKGGDGASVFTSIEETTGPTNKESAWCHISDAPALCDWSFPLGCLTDVQRPIN